MCKKYKIIKSDFYKILLNTLLIILIFQTFLSCSVKSYVTSQTPARFSPEICFEYNVKIIFTNEDMRVWTEIICPKIRFNGRSIQGRRSELQL